MKAMVRLRRTICVALLTTYVALFTTGCALSPVDFGVTVSNPLTTTPSFYLRFCLLNDEPIVVGEAPEATTWGWANGYLVAGAPMRACGLGTGGFS